MKPGSSRASIRVVACGVLAILAAAVSSAQSAASEPAAAYDLLRKSAERGPERSRACAFVTASVVGVGCAAGAVAWALAPHYMEWGPADPQEAEGYPGHGLMVGLLQVLLQPAVLVPWIADQPRRAREALAAVQDEPDPEARELLAAAALERLARRARNSRAAATGAYVGLAALSIGAYCVGENMIGRDPDAAKVGPSYVATVAVGTACFAVFGMLQPTAAERTYREYLRARGCGQ